MHNNNNSGVNTIILVIILAIIVGGLVWLFNGSMVPTDDGSQDGINVDVSLPTVPEEQNDEIE